MLLLENEYSVYLTTNTEEYRQVILTLIRLPQGTREDIQIYCCSKERAINKRLLQKKDYLFLHNTTKRFN